MPQLRSLDVNCHVDVSVCRAWQRLPHLSNLTLSLTHVSDTAAASLLLKGLEHITSLKSLELTESYSQVDSAASLRACANGILQHSNIVSGLLTYNHGQELKTAAAGAEVRQLGPPPSASMLLEALAPWQPQSGKAIEELGLWHLSDVTREALEWLPVNIKSLELRLLLAAGLCSRQGMAER
ncbi:hypothetical protein HaLaN_18911 [Haematococcus lacustris]|uniref:Uncharacterized protein n=1 Tax=Haematococcus lacustris TaxID=44745 RepID=A0A699ZFR6_HAELA|nr:hypothetical protein HaLaN_18911 [Haematococcus lacustris]